MISAVNFIKLCTYSALREEKKYDKLKNVWIGIPIISYLFENHQCHMLRQSQQKKSLD